MVTKYSDYDTHCKDSFHDCVWNVLGGVYTNDDLGVIYNSLPDSIKFVAMEWGD